MKTSVSRSAHPALKRLVLALMGAALLSLPLSVSGNPVGPVVRHGQASFARPDAQSLVVTNSPGAIIHWQGFSIGQGEITRFVQQSSQSAVLNRVVAQNPSLILGQLSSNGRVFLINPAGIAVGPGGMVDTAGFVASTLNLTDADFLAGRLRFEGGPGSGAIANAGEIVSRDGGSIVLVGPRIENSGLIRAEGGAVVLAAGQKLEIASLDSPAVRFEIQAPQDSALNLGRIEAAGGAVGVFAGTLRHSGAIRADTVRVDETGRVVLAASKDIVLEPGSLVSASGAPGGVHDGGSVRIVAEEALDLQRGSQVHVDGGPDGGHGGFLELSGNGAIALNGTYTGRAQQPGYRNGSVLFDPASIRIESEGGTTGGDGVVLASDAPGTALVLGRSALSGAWSSVSLAATNDIDVNTELGTGDLAAGGSLTLEAGHDVNVNAGIGNATVRFDHDLTLRAGNRVGVNAPIYLNDNTLTAKADTIAIDALVNVGSAGTLVLDAVTGSSQSAPIVAGTLDLRGATAQHTLLDPGNQVSAFKANTGFVSLASNGSIVVTGTELPGLGSETIVLAPAVAGAFMGSRISVSGDVMIVGAPSENGNAGAAYVYRWNGTTWVFEQRLVSPDPPDGDPFPDGFGGALAVEGNLIVVGASAHSEPGFQRAGAGYTWRFDGTAWTYTGKLTFTERVFESTFGNSLDIDNGRLVVGGVGRTSENGFWTGKIWFYDYVGGAGTGWVERGNAIQSDPQNNDYFGYSLDISGDRMVVGAYMATPLGTTGNGKAYLFDFNPATRQWVETQRITASNPQANAHFGMDVSISGDVAAVGAGSYDGGGLADTGAAYVFRYNGASWIQEQLLTRSSPVPVDLFGYRVAVDNGILTAGAYGIDAGGTTNAGAAYLYTHDGTQWTLARELTASNRVANDAFGIDVFADARAVYVGAYARDQGPVSNTGAVYTFDASPVASVASGMDVTATGDLTQAAKVQSGGVVRYEANRIAINNALNVPTTWVVLTAATSMSQTAPITTAGLRVAGPSATFELTDTRNTVQEIAGYVGALDYRTQRDIFIGAVDASVGLGAAGSMRLEAGMAILQREPVAASTLELLGGTQVILTHPGNHVGQMAASVGALDYLSAYSLEIASVGATNGVTAHGDIAIRSVGGTTDLRISAPVTNAGATGAIDLIADRSIIVGNGASIGSDVSPTTITLNADRDGTGGGSIRLNGATLRSLGSDIVLGGGTAPATTPARGLAGTGPDTVGVLLDGTTIVDAGTVRITGTGGAGTGSAHGVQVSGGSIASSGGISISGTGGSGGNGNTGVRLGNDTRIEALGAALLTVTGTGGTGASTNAGVLMTSGACLTADDGALSVTGTGGGSGASNLGVYMDGGSRIASFGAGAVTVSGQGSTSAVNDNEGVFLRDPGTQIYTVNADLTVRGTGGGSGINNTGVVLWQGAAIQSDGSGAIRVEGTGAGTAGNGIWTGVGSNLIGGPSSIGPITLVATGSGSDAIVLRDVDVMGGGVLTVQPGNPAASIGLAGEPGEFNLDMVDLDNIWSFGEFVLGRPDGTGTIRIGALPGAADSDGRAVSGTGDIVIAEPLDFGNHALSFSTGGNISQRGPITAGTVTLERGTWWSSDTITGNFVNQGGTVQPGASPGVFTIRGNYTQDVAGTLVIELGGPAPGQYDQLVVTGMATLGGTMRVSMFGDFTGAPGLQFEPVRYASASGAFASVAVPAGFDFTFGDHGIHYGVDISGIPQVIPTLPAEIAGAMVMPQVLGLQESFEDFALDPWLGSELVFGTEEAEAGAEAAIDELTPLPLEIRRRGTTCF